MAHLRQEQDRAAIAGVVMCISKRRVCEMRRATTHGAHESHSKEASKAEMVTSRIDCFEKLSA